MYLFENFLKNNRDYISKNQIYMGWVFGYSPLIIKRKYAPILIGFLFCFLGLFEKIGSALNSYMGGFFFDTSSTFDLLIIIQGLVAIFIGAIVLLFAIKKGDKNTELIGTK